MKTLNSEKGLMFIKENTKGKWWAWKNKLLRSEKGKRVIHKKYINSRMRNFKDCNQKELQLKNVKNIKLKN